MKIYANKTQLQPASSKFWKGIFLGQQQKQQQKQQQQNQHQQHQRQQQQHSKVKLFFFRALTILFAQ